MRYLLILACLLLTGCRTTAAEATMSKRENLSQSQQLEELKKQAEKIQEQLNRIEDKLDK